MPITNKSKKAFFILALLLAGLTACDGRLSPQVISHTDSRLSQQDEKTHFQGALFTGVVEKHLEGVLVEKTPYKNGLIHGDQEGWHSNGNRAFVRPHELGKKIDAHRGWYETGKPRHLFWFDNDLFHGENWEWQRDGNLYKYSVYEKGEQVGGKIWRSDGKIYANFVMTKERILGLPGGNLCRIVEKDENGNATKVR